MATTLVDDFDDSDEEEEVFMAAKFILATVYW